jgi:molybdopterin molybdotransferase
VVFEIFVRPALLKMAGRENIFRPRIRAIAEDPIQGQANRVDFQRAIITQKDGKYYAKTTGPQGSGVLYSLVVANGLVTVPMGTNIKAGEEVEAELFAMLEE